jgi:hypothetical protein
MNSQPRAAEPVIELAPVENAYRSGKFGFPSLSGKDLAITAHPSEAKTSPAAL